MNKCVNVCQSVYSVDGTDCCARFGGRSSGNVDKKKDLNPRSSLPCPTHGRIVVPQPPRPRCSRDSPEDLSKIIYVPPPQNHDREDTRKPRGTTTATELSSPIETKSNDKVGTCVPPLKQHPLP